MKNEKPLITYIAEQMELCEISRNALSKKGKLKLKRSAYNELFDKGLWDSEIIFGLFVQAIDGKSDQPKRVRDVVMGLGVKAMKAKKEYEQQQCQPQTLK